MKKLNLATVCLLSASFITNQAMASDATVDTKKVSYQCDHNKTVTVHYGFNKEGEPTIAAAKLAGKKVYMPVNFKRTQGIDTVFGMTKGFTLATADMNVSNYDQQPILITSPSQEIIFKNCDVVLK